MRPRVLVAAVAIFGSAACDGAEHRCGSGDGNLPEGLEIIAWDNGSGESVRGQGFNVTSGTQTFDLDDEPLYEAVRFAVDRPARIHGFSVQWSNLDSAGGPDREIAAGLYPDFGHNGFDSWRFEPVWSGTRCLKDVRTDEFVEYVLPEPIEVGQPGLIFVGHESAIADDPTFAFDDDYEGNGDCLEFQECHSAIALYDALENIYKPGLSFPFQYDFLARLHVEYLDDPPAKTVFQAVAASPTLNLRMAWGDYDNDGWDDLITTGPVLHHNQGDGTFLITTSASGIAVGGTITSGSWGDYDNDGCLDLFLTSEYLHEPNALFHSNCDGTFTDVTAVAGVDGAQSANTCGNPAMFLYSQSESASWVDIDSDGRLDVYVANYNCATDLSNYVDNVYRNNGDGTFADWTGANGFLTEAFAGRGAAPIDYDFDGDIDILVHNYVLERDLFFRNNGDGTVTEIGLENGLAGKATIFQGKTYYGHTLGTAWGDLDRDGDWDAVVANLAHPRFFHFSDKSRVMINDGAGIFSDISGDWSYPASSAGLRYQETHTVPTLADFDQDGILDLVISARYDGRPTDFYWGNGDGTFRLDVLRAGAGTMNGWGGAAADFDHDGDQDLATTPTLFRNVLENQRTKGSWLQVHAVGNVASNRAAIGATVKVLAGGHTLLRHVQGGTGQGCQDSLNLHFGLGTAATADSIEVSFPAGAIVNFPGPFPANTRIWLYENGEVRYGWSNPT